MTSLEQDKRNIQIGRQMIAAMVAATPPTRPTRPTRNDGWALLANGYEYVQLTPVEREMSALLAAGNFREAEKLLPEYDAEAFGHTHRSKKATPKPEPKVDPTPFQDLWVRVHGERPEDQPILRVYGSLDAFLVARAERRKAKLSDVVKRSKRSKAAPGAYAGQTTMTLAFDPYAAPRYPGATG